MSVFDALRIEVLREISDKLARTLTYYAQHGKDDGRRARKVLNETGIGHVAFNRSRKRKKK